MGKGDVLAGGARGYLEPDPAGGLGTPTWGSFSPSVAFSGAEGVVLGRLPGGGAGGAFGFAGPLRAAGVSRGRRKRR